MKAIIIAAGPGSRLFPHTENKPKCMLNVKGKPILQRTLETLRKCGVNDIVVVRGHAAEKINFDGVKYCYNEEYKNNNILASLFCAENEMNDEFIFSYSDILYNEEIVKNLLKSRGEFSVITDSGWKDRYEGRTLHPIEEAENIVLDGDKIVKIGKHLTADESHGEFIGLVKFSKNGVEILKKVYSELKKKGEIFQKAKSFEKAYMTDMIQELVDRGHSVNAVKIDKGWWEVDTPQDYEKVCNELE